MPRSGDAERKTPRRIRGNDPDWMVDYLSGNSTRKRTNARQVLSECRLRNSTLSFWEGPPHLLPLCAPRRWAKCADRCRAIGDLLTLEEKIWRGAPPLVVKLLNFFQPASKNIRCSGRQLANTSLAHVGSRLAFLRHFVLDERNNPCLVSQLISLRDDGENAIGKEGRAELSQQRLGAGPRAGCDYHHLLGRAQV